MEFAGFWRRVVAAIVDQLISVLPFVVVTSMLEVWSIVLTAAPGTGLTVVGVGMLVLWGATVLWSVGYFVYFEGKTGLTIGKRLLHLKIVRADQPNRDGIGYGRALVRLVVGVVTRIPANLGFAWMLMDPQGRTFQDLAVKTIVIHDASGKFGAFDPDKLPRARRRTAWFVLLIIASVFTLLTFIPTSQS